METTYKGSKTLMPQCVATYDRGHEQCDGDPNGEAETDRMPCVFRDRCIAMAFYGRENKLERSQLIQLVNAKPRSGGRVQTWAIAAGDDGELQSALKATITKYKIKDGIAVTAPAVTGRGVRPASPAGSAASRIGGPGAGPAEASAAAPAAKRGAAVNVEGRRVIDELDAHFRHNLSSRTGRTIANSHGEAAVGQMFVVDRREKSSYCSIYVKGADGKRIALASIHYRPNNAALEVRVAAPFRTFTALFSAQNKARVKPEDCDGRDGHFKVRFHHLDKMGLGLVAEAIDRASKHGILDLPPPA